LAYWPTTREILLLALLGGLFTAVPQTLLVRSLKYVKAQFASIMVGLEPVYAIIFAIMLLNEIPAITTVIGGGFILFAVMLATNTHNDHQKRLLETKYAPE